MKGGEGSPFLVMPDIESEAYLVRLWEEAGVVDTSGMGVTRLSWKEIEAWLNVREMRGELPLTSWEIETVRKLSEEYATEYSAATDVDREAPYVVESIEQVDRPAVMNKFKSILGTFKKADDGPRYTVEE